MKNFFEHQAEAQRRTRWLLLGMVVAVFGMGGLLFAVLWLMQHMTLSYLHLASNAGPELGGHMFWGCVLGTAAVVLLASLWRTLSLRAAGAGIAEMLGGRLISGQPRDALERRLLNVVEEISIAAGAPVPRVFVLDAEPGINALAAGWELHDATIAVTRGCLEQLTRAELQGVIGHELSHVLHGDMRLNVRLMGAVFGILFISLLGRHTMRAANLSRRNAAPVLLLGLGMLGIGALGALCANLIKAAVSRQREFLADASSVQFTRDPSSIVSALKKIGGHTRGARLDSGNAEEASHFFFGDIQQRALRVSPFATHPPLIVRIQRLDPSFDGKFPRSNANAQIEPTSTQHGEGSAPLDTQTAASIAAANTLQHAETGVVFMRESGTASQSTRIAGVAPGPDHAAIDAATPLDNDASYTQAATVSDTPGFPASSARNPAPPAALVLRLAGTANTTAIKASKAWLADIPEPLHSAAENPYSACALMYAALLSDQPSTRQDQERSIETLAGAELLLETQRLAPLVQSLVRADRLLLIDLISPALQALVARQRAIFSRTLQALIDADSTLSIFEYVLGNLLLTQTCIQPGQRRTQRLALHIREVELLVSLLAHAGDLDGTGAASAFAQAAMRLRALPISLLPSSPRLLSGLGPALDQLRALRPTDSAQLIDACSHAVLADQRATDTELTLLRAVCLSLGVPIPLLG